MIDLAPVNPGRTHRWRGALATAVSCCVPLAVAVVYVKYRVLGLGVWRAAVVVPQGPLEYASYFGADVMEGLVVAPLFLVILLGWLPMRRRAIAMAAVSALVTALIAAGWLTLLGAGAWPTPGLVRDFSGAILTDAGLVNPLAYLPRMSVLRAVALVALGLVPLIVALARARLLTPESLLARRVVVVLPLVVLAGATVIRPSGVSVGLERGVLSLVLGGLVPRSGYSPATEGPAANAAAEWSRLTYPESLATLTPGPAVTAPAQSCRSAILVILETASDRDYSWETLRAAMPRTRWYLDRALVTRRHFASHPWSNRSDFTILGGLYDLTDDRPLQSYLRRAQAPPGSAPGIAPALRRSGYQLMYFYPGRYTVEDDDWAVGYLGFQDAYTPEIRGPASDPSRRREREVEAFARAEAALRAMPAGRPFFMVLRTMIGHDPVMSPRTGKYLDAADTAARSSTYRDVAAFVDSLLGGVVEAAARHQDPSRIAIAIVGDHGIRNRQDPDLAGPEFPLVSYRVPAVISCPSLFDRPVFTEHNTSHVDIAPTLAWVLGVDQDLGPAHGTVMTDARLKDRYTFLFAAKTGVDALIHGDTISVVSRVYEPPYRVLMDSSRTRTRVLDRDPPLTRSAEARFAAVRKAQYRVIGQLSRKRS